MTRIDTGNSKRTPHVHANSFLSHSLSLTHSLSAYYARLQPAHIQTAAFAFLLAWKVLFYKRFASQSSNTMENACFSKAYTAPHRRHYPAIFSRFIILSAPHLHTSSPTTALPFDFHPSHSLTHYISISISPKNSLLYYLSLSSLSCLTFSFLPHSPLYFLSWSTSLLSFFSFCLRHP